MVYRILILAVAALYVAMNPAWAGGSVFSANGVGEQLPRGGTRVQGLGGGGFGLADSMSFNTGNPALAAFVPRTQFRLGGQVGFWTTTADGETDADAEFVWQDAAVYVPVTKIWRFGIGAQPLRKMDLFTLEPRQAVFGDDTIQYEARNRWQGSAVELRLDNAFRLTEQFSVGLSAAYILSRQERTQTLDFPRSGNNPYYYDVEYHQRETFRGWAPTFGLHYQANQIGIGLAYRPRMSGNWTYDFAKEGADSSLKSERSGDSPGDMRAGLSYRFPGRWVAVADFQAGQWSKGDLGILADQINAPAPVNPLWISVGMERLAGRPPQKSGFQLWGYRAGAYYRKHYWQAPQGANVEDLGFTAGLSLPVASGQGWLHVAAEAGMRGLDEQKLGATENYFRTAVQIEIGETWFQRSRPRIPK